ncbi:enoyl-CoA hydratase [Thermocladium modestius]|uniref:Enoyl-CoA hydratase n=1 Tax=Thermocladium modestius TaxID=62609 RepID=A0A830GUW4_9CREN|nr:enoyl-CoA hydratase/isomerase family protein [Thermocladium modestius]GGP21628.1 enoyl-CoA hydratase [Thermocladium modestius]
MQSVELDSINGISIVYLNRPEKRNSFNSVMISEVIASIKRECAEARGIVLTGRTYFSAGLDLEEIYGFSTLEQASKYFNSLKELVEAITACEKPIVAFVNGSAYGFAVELLYFMDRVIAVDSAKFSLPGVKYGIVPVTPAFSRMLGLWGRALLDPSFNIDARDAARLGLVNEVVDSIDSGYKASLNAVERLSSVPGDSFKLFKQLMMGSLVSDAMPREEELVKELSRHVIKPETKGRLEEFIKRKREK